MDELIEKTFPEATYYRQTISSAVRLADHVYDKVLELKETDEVAGYFSAWPDLVVMHKKSNPTEGTYFVRIFEEAIELSDQELSIYRQWYPLDHLILIIKSSEEGISLADYVEGRSVTPLTNLLP